MPRCCKVPEVNQFSQLIAGNFSNNQLILPARDERTALSLSISLYANFPAYMLGETPDSGIVFRLLTTDTPLKLCRSELGDLITLPLWNVTGALLRARVNEVWEVPTGRMVEVQV